LTQDPDSRSRQGGFVDADVQSFLTSLAPAKDSAPQLAPGAKHKVFVVEERANPSTDLYVMPAICGIRHAARRCGPADLPSHAELAGASVVFVRYVPGAWVKLIDAAPRPPARIVLFIDDDLLDVNATSGLRLRYRYKLARSTTTRAGWLARRQAQLWVSTPHLMDKYSSWKPQLVHPAAVAAPQRIKRVFYHGSASHEGEQRWLLPVIESVIRQEPNMVFEIIGGQDIHRLYRGVPRVTVVHPMDWPAYQAFSGLPGRHVGLAPQLDTPFNRARSYVKFMDITRSGAVGIYSRGSVNANAASNGPGGLIVPMQAAAWTEAILRLAADDELRESLLAQAVQTMTTLDALARAQQAMGQGR
jgi:hypothetical protein